MKRESGYNPLQPTVTVKLMKPVCKGILAATELIREGTGSKLKLSQETCLIFADSFGGEDRCV